MKELVCIVCPKGCRLHVDEQNGFAVTGNSCPRGEEYGRNELKNPTRVLTSTVKISGALHSRCPVKTDRPIAKREVAAVRLQAPVAVGEIVVDNIAGTGANLVAAKNVKKL